MLINLMRKFEARLLEMNSILFLSVIRGLGRGENYSLGIIFILTGGLFLYASFQDLR